MLTPWGLLVKLNFLEEEVNNGIDKRIYVIVATTVQLNGKITAQPAGRLMAQVGHVVSKLRLQMAKKLRRRGGFTPITTIVLAARDVKELDHICLLLDAKYIGYVDFYDTNPPVYGPGEVKTAIAIEPIEPYLLEGITDYLPLYS